MNRAYGPHEFSVTETQAFGLGWYSAHLRCWYSLMVYSSTANEALTINNFITETLHQRIGIPQLCFEVYALSPYLR